MVCIEGEPELAAFEQLNELLRVHRLGRCCNTVKLLRREEKLLFDFSLKLLLVLLVRSHLLKMLNHQLLHSHPHWVNQMHHHIPQPRLQSLRL
jgi:energy-converting hydrogenase Eha subunit F